MNSFNFFLSGKLFICPSFLMIALLGRESNLGCRSPLFKTLNIACESLLAWNSPVVTNFFSLAAFKILFIFNLWHFNYDVLWRGPLVIHLVWDSMFPGLACLFPSQNQGSFFFMIFSNRFPISCSFSFPSTPVMQVKCGASGRYPTGCLHYPRFFGFFFLLIVLIACFLLPYVPNHWFDSWLHPLYYCFPINCY